jgi:two-component system, LuxR family, response regulator FixJ
MGHRSALRYPSLIDDDEAVLEALRHYLTRQNVRTSCFKDAKNFLTALDHQEPFDCVVSDVRMPGMSGLDLVQHLNKRSYAQPIIAELIRMAMMIRGH